VLRIRDLQRGIRTIEGGATSVLTEAGAIRECEEHGWMKDRTDSHARHCAIEIAREDPPPGFSTDRAVSAVQDVLNSISDTCPECPPNDD
jgi:hypothetical protein